MAEREQATSSVVAVFPNHSDAEEALHARQILQNTRQTEIEQFQMPQAAPA